MNLPGFYAEGSLQKGSTVFHAAGRNGERQGLRILPQLRPIGNPTSQCYAWCFLNGGSPLQCFFACGPGQLGGPGWLSAGLLA